LALVAREERATAAAATTAAVEVKGARAVLEATGTEAAAAVVVAWAGGELAYHPVHGQAPPPVRNARHRVRPVAKPCVRLAAVLTERVLPGVVVSWPALAPELVENWRHISRHVGQVVGARAEVIGVEGQRYSAEGS